MKYVAFDNEVFDNEEDCIAHERANNFLAKQMEDVDRFLNETRPDATDRAKKMSRNHIEEWLIWYSKLTDELDPE